MKRVKELAEKLNPGSTTEAKGPADIKMPTMKVKDEVKESEKNNQNEIDSKIIIPGLTSQDKDKNAKKAAPLIMEMQGSDKYKPNFEMTHLPANDENYTDGAN